MRVASRAASQACHTSQGSPLRSDERAPTLFPINPPEQNVSGGILEERDSPLEKDKPSHS